MMRIEFAEYWPRLKAILRDAHRLCVDEHPVPETRWADLLARQEAGIETAGALRLVLIGEFSAGKSAIISSLTGQDILIDADVATQDTTPYPWKGLVLVDTPGVQSSDSETDHDRIAREATIGADMVMFVVTNELFNDRLAAHLDYVVGVGGLRLAAKTAVVVNKIDREQNTDETIIGEVARVLGDNAGRVPIWLCAARRYLESKTAPERLRERFIRQSRMPELAADIEKFVSEAGVWARLTTPLQGVEDVLDHAHSALTDSPDALKRLELLRRQKRVLVGLKGRLINIRREQKQRASTTVMKAAEDAVTPITEKSAAQDLEQMFADGMAAARGDLDAVYDHAQAEITTAYSDAQQEMDDMGESPLARAVEELDRAVGAAQVGFSESKPKAGTTFARGTKTVIDPLKQGLLKMAKDPKKLRDVVYGVGKRFGKKFRPWEAVKGGEKLAKGLGRLGKALPFVAAALDFYINYREEKAKDEQEQYLAKARIALRLAFAEQAKMESDAIEEAVGALSNGPVSEALRAVEKRTDEIVSSLTRYAELGSQIAKLKKDCRDLRDDVERLVRVVAP